MLIYLLLGKQAFLIFQFLPITSCYQLLDFKVKRRLETWNFTWRRIKFCVCETGYTFTVQINVSLTDGTKSISLRTEILSKVDGNWNYLTVSFDQSIDVSPETCNGNIHWKVPPLVYKNSSKLTFTLSPFHKKWLTCQNRWKKTTQFSLYLIVWLVFDAQNAMASL